MLHFGIPWHSFFKKIVETSLGKADLSGSKENGVPVVEAINDQADDQGHEGHEGDEEEHRDVDEADQLDERPWIIEEFVSDGRLNFSPEKWKS